MTVESQPRRLGNGKVLAFAVSAGIVIVAILGAHAARSAARSEAERVAAVELAHATATLLRAVHLAVDSVDVIAGHSAGAGGPEAVAGLAVSAHADGVTSVSWLDRAGGASARTALAVTLGVARDEGRVRLSGPYEESGERVIAAARAVYTTGTTLTADPGTGTSGQRRELLAGWVVGIIPTDTLINAAAGDRLALTAVDGSSTVGRSVRRDGDSIGATTVEVGGRVWTLQAAADVAPPLAGRFWAILIGGFFIATVAGVSARSYSVRGARLRDEMSGLRDELAMIADVAPVVQRSLDLDAVLPAVAVRLSDRLALSGVSFAFVDDSGRSVEIFAYGAPTDVGKPAVTNLRQGVPPHSTLAISLQRGGRVRGVLRARTSRALSATETASLGAVAEMMSSAIINAQMFENQARAVQRLSEVDALKTAFLETASHELRTPVTAIAGFARLVHDEWDDLPEDQRRLFMDRIFANAGVLDNLVGDLLNFSRIERGGLQTQTEAVSLSELVPGVVTRLLPVFDEHRILTELAPGVVVAGDQKGIEQLFTNLLSNAAKFSAPDSEIVARVTQRAGRGVLVVDDAGPGVPLPERERIFSRFFRGRSAEVIRTRGAGIGLSVVKALADKMKATVEVGDSPAGGARFTVSFPVPADRATDTNKEETNATQS